MILQDQDLARLRLSETKQKLFYFSILLLGRFLAARRRGSEHFLMNEAKEGSKITEAKALLVLNSFAWKVSRGDAPRQRTFFDERGEGGK